MPGELRVRSEVPPSPDYWIYVLDERNRVFSPVHFVDAKSDALAVEMAKRLSAGRTTELRQGNRLVARFKADSCSSGIARRSCSGSR